MKKLKLTQLAKKELAKKRMSNVKGGACGSSNGCGCGCLYTPQNGIDSFTNMQANFGLGISTNNV